MGAEGWVLRDEGAGVRWGVSDAIPEPFESRVPDGARVAVVRTRWNEDVVGPLTRACVARLGELGAAVDLETVPGAFELPVAAKLLAGTKRYGAVVLIGCVIRGDTPHFDYVAGEAARGCTDVALATGVPVIFGVLTVNTHQQAVDRLDSGPRFADAAAEMLLLRAKLTNVPAV